MLSDLPTRSAAPLGRSAWAGRVVVVSPHLDDAVFSLGISIHAATRRGIAVDVLTVLAGDPSSATPSDDSNRRAGFATAGEAARLRRVEDQRACERLGARAVWLDLNDDRNDDPVSDDALRETIVGAIEGYDTVLAPGFPLTHADHLRVGCATLDVLPAGRALGLYVEQPYASWLALARSRRAGAPTRATAPATLGLALAHRPRWSRFGGRPADWAAKFQAMKAYASQLAVLRRAPRERIVGYEALHGGESVMWLELG